jgi:hypothetical protein
VGMSIGWHAKFAQARGLRCGHRFLSTSCLNNFTHLCELLLLGRACRWSCRLQVLGLATQQLLLGEDLPRRHAALAIPSSPSGRGGLQLKTSREHRQKNLLGSERPLLPHANNSTHVHPSPLSHGPRFQRSHRWFVPRIQTKQACRQPPSRFSVLKFNIDHVIPRGLDGKFTQCTHGFI